MKGEAFGREEVNPLGIFGDHGKGIGLASPVGRIDEQLRLENIDSSLAGIGSDL